MSNLVTRTLTGAVFVVVMIGGILWNLWSYIGLFSLIALAGLWEFYRLFEIKEKEIRKIPGLLLGILMIAACSAKYFLQTNNLEKFNVLFLAILIFPTYLIVKLFSKEPSFNALSPTLFGIFYSVLPFCYLILLFSSVGWYNSDNNARIVLGFFFLIWSNDTFAYLVGMSIGRTKLFERISPKKTWEGTLGGVICTQGIAYLLSLWFTELQPLHWHMIALIVSITGTLGDLVESMFKRSMGVKDSGNILPGHGGILDRFDAVLIAAPFVVCYLMLMR